MRARPRRLRRLSAFRPPVVFMRARNPCLFTRLRLRGLYVGFISGSPIHGKASLRVEPGKIDRLLREGQLDHAAGVYFGPPHPLSGQV